MPDQNERKNATVLVTHTFSTKKIQNNLQATSKMVGFLFTLIQAETRLNKKKERSEEAIDYKLNEGVQPN